MHTICSATKSLDTEGLLGEFEVQDEDNSRDQSGDNGSNGPFVPVHPPGHARQDLLALSDIIVYSTKLHVSEN